MNRQMSRRRDRGRGCHPPGGGALPLRRTHEPFTWYRSATSGPQPSACDRARQTAGQAAGQSAGQNAGRPRARPARPAPAASHASGQASAVGRRAKQRRTPAK